MPGETVDLGLLDSDIHEGNIEKLMNNHVLGSSNYELITNLLIHDNMKPRFLSQVLNNDGETIFHALMREPDAREKTEIFFKSGKVAYEAAKIRDNSGNTMFHTLMGNNIDQWFSFLDKKDDNSPKEDFVNCEIDLDLCMLLIGANHKSENVLHIAAKSDNYLEKMERLLSVHAAMPGLLSQSDGKGYTVLDIIMYRFDRKGIELLKGFIDKGELEYEDFFHWSYYIVLLVTLKWVFLYELVRGAVPSSIAQAPADSETLLRSSDLGLAAPADVLDDNHDHSNLLC
jgi:hypothetical protein